MRLEADAWIRTKSYALGILKHVSPAEIISFRQIVYQNAADNEK